MCDKVTIEIDAKWARWINSPWCWPMAALTGVSITFAPLYLYWQGQTAETWKVAVCFAVIYLVPLFYIKLSTEVIRSLRRQTGKERGWFYPR
ncbi:MAG: hypothetical protein NTW96_22605 [Planctomycetia bacterium]|nr:hypothetical protein [Planctomycetia bacterium]